ncbi:MAG TPA: hypothetical protein VMU51_09145, partial [Mycobacteriales bacterium]|nr:hypothetical protein [Mycobacteriales bacterium]
MTGSPGALLRFGELRVGAWTELPPSELDIRYDGALAGAGLVLAAAARLRPCAGATLCGLEWSGSGAPGPVRAMLTRRRVTDGRGILHQALVGAGTAALTWEVELATYQPAARDLALDDIGGVGWGRRLADRLDQDEDFRSSASTFDGAIGLRSGGTEVQLRIYRGRVIEAAR